MEEQAELVQRAQRGDLAAYGEIVRRFQDMAVGYAYAVLGDFHLAEDAAQEAFIEAFAALSQLREPRALASWLRRIVFKHCDRITRGRHPSVSLDATEAIETAAHGPAESVEQRETADQVLAAIRGLPDHEREVTALFYINGYSLRDIAAFLDVPEGTVKSRLHTSRGHLKERLTNMVEDTLKRHAPDERFSRRVIDALLARPNLIEIKEHPVCRAWEALRNALAEYEVVQGSELEDQATFAAADDHAWDLAYRVQDKALRYQMTTVTITAMRGRTPPVHLLAAGRVFRPDREDTTHSKVFHQVDGVSVQAGADVETFKAACERAIRGPLPQAALEWHGHDYGFVSPGFSLSVSVGSRKHAILGGGMLKADTLRRAGFDSDHVQGFAWGLSLERIAMLANGIDDIRKLWQPPHVPERTA